MKQEKLFLKDNTEQDDLICKLLDVTKALKIDEKDVQPFIQNILSNQSHKLNNLKILYFDISQEIERKEKIKKRIENSANTRITIILFLMLTVLIIQTGLYYHLIFNVDHLGWDLMEPTTFLLSSILFMIGIFIYVKLHRNAISGERLFQEYKKGFKLRRYVRDNFNHEKYLKLQTRKELVAKEIESYLH